MSEGKSPPYLIDPHGKTAESFDQNYAIRIMLILAGIVTLVMYIEGMLTPSLYSIKSDFGVTIAQVSLVLSVYLVTGVALSPIVGKLGDIYGKKKIMVVVISIYAAAVSVTGFSPNFEFMVASRTIQGVGLTILPLAMSLVREEFPRDMIPRAQGILSAMFGAGFAISLPLGSFVSNTWGWRATYHSAIPLVVFLLLMIVFLLRESPFRRPNVWLDIPGAALLGTSLGLVVLALAQGSTWGWSSTLVLALITVGVALLVPLVMVERKLYAKGKEVILDIRLLSIRNVMVTNLVVFISGFGMFLAMQAMVFRFELPSPVGYSKSIFATGLSLLPFGVSMIIVAPIVSILVSRFGTKPFTVAGCLIGALGFYLASLTVSFWQIIGVLFIIGGGLAMLNASIVNLLVLTVEAKDMGLGTSMNAVFRNMGSSIGAPVAGSVMSTFTASVVIGTYKGVPISQVFPDHTAFQITFYIAAVVFLGAAIVTLFGKEILGKRAHREAPASNEGSDARSPTTYLATE